MGENYYDAEFKIQAVKRVLETEKTASAVAKEVGCSAPALRRWVTEYQEKDKNPFPGKGIPRDEELSQLRKELRETQEERDILKKAISIFSRTKR